MLSGNNIIELDKLTSKFQKAQNKNNINIKKECKNQIISMILDNAANMGWNVKKNKKNVYTFKKKIIDLTKNEQNTNKLVDMFFDIRNFE